MRNVGFYSGHPGRARDFIVQNFKAVAVKASRAGRAWILSAAFPGFNEKKEADALVREREAKRLPELLQSITKQQTTAFRR